VLIFNFNKRKDSKVNEPAFPAMHFDLADNEHGLTMRDYFAAKAMQAIMAGQYPITKQHDAASRIALAAYQMADAMLEARNAAQ
jgi:hypothetical protein